MTHVTASRRGHLAGRLAAAMFATIVLCGCGVVTPGDPAPTSSSQEASRDLLAAHDLAGLGVRQIIERLDTMPVAKRPADLLASVRPEALVLTDDRQREARLPMPADEVYVSVAPYRDSTHECHFHSLTTCRGELADARVRLRLTSDDGTVVLDQTRRTYANGFVGIWVPRGTEGVLTVEHEGRRGAGRISTLDADDPTCVTTVRVR